MEKRIVILIFLMILTDGLAFGTAEHASERRAVELDSHLVFHGLEMTSIIQVPLENGFYRWDLWDKADHSKNLSILEDGLISAFAWKNLLTNSRFSDFQNENSLANWTQVGGADFEYTGEKVIITSQDNYSYYRLRQNISGLLEGNSTYFFGGLAKYEKVSGGSAYFRITQGASNAASISIGNSSVYQYYARSFNTGSLNLNNLYFDIYLPLTEGRLTVTDVWLVKISNLSYPPTNYALGDGLPRQFVPGARLFTIATGGTACNGVDGWCGGGHGGDKDVVLDFDSQENYLKVTRKGHNHFFNNTVYYVYDWKEDNVYESYKFTALNDFAIGDAGYYGMQTNINNYEEFTEYLNGQMIGNTELDHTDSFIGRNNENDQAILFESGNSYWTNNSILYTLNGDSSDVEGNFIWSRSPSGSYDKNYVNLRNANVAVGRTLLGNIWWKLGNYNDLSDYIGNDFIPDYLIYSNGDLVKTVANDSVSLTFNPESEGILYVSADSYVKLRVVGYDELKIDGDYADGDIVLSPGEHLIDLNANFSNIIESYYNGEIEILELSSILEDYFN